MRQVSVRTDWIRSKVADNRRTHEAEFKEAMVGYRKAAIEALEKNLAEFESGERTELSWHETPPENHLKDYDRVIAMLDACVDDTVTLTAEEFAQYVQDDWQWQAFWKVSNTRYITAAKGNTKR